MLQPKSSSPAIGDQLTRHTPQITKRLNCLEMFLREREEKPIPWADLSERVKAFCGFAPALEGMKASLVALREDRRFPQHELIIGKNDVVLKRRDISTVAARQEQRPAVKAILGRVLWEVLFRVKLFGSPSRRVDEDIRDELLNKLVTIRRKTNVTLLLMRGRRLSRHVANSFQSRRFQSR